MPPPKQQQKKSTKNCQIPSLLTSHQSFLQLKTEILDLLMKFKKWVKKNVFSLINLSQWSSIKSYVYNISLRIQILYSCFKEVSF